MLLKEHDTNCPFLMHLLRVYKTCNLFNFVNLLIFVIHLKVIYMFNPEILKSARLLAGISLRELQNRLEGIVSHNAISKYEQGVMIPDISTIIRLAEVLGIRPGEFFIDSKVSLGKIDFRKKSSLSKTEVAQIQEKTKQHVERYLEVEGLLNLSAKFNNPIAKRIVKSAPKAEEMAEIVRADWGLGTFPISNVIETLEEREVKVIEVAASEKFDGLSTYVDERIPVAVVNENFPAERKRFTVLHELGHLMMNIPNSESKTCESYCHRFAAALLFPASEVFQTLGQKRKSIAMGELVAIKEEYGISVQAAMRRAYDLEIISQQSYKSFCIKMAGNRREEGLGSFKGVERSHRLLQLVFRLASEKVVTLERAAALLDLSLAKFKALFYNLEEGAEEYTYRSPASSFSAAWGDDESEYSFKDLKTLNPVYEA